MKTTRDVKGVGLSIPRPDGPEKVTGQRPVRGGPQAARPAAREAPAEPARARPDHPHRHEPGEGPARRARGPDRRRHPRSSRRRRRPARTPCWPSTAWSSSGQPVAAVAADELAIAEEALDLIEVEYEVLPGRRRSARSRCSPARRRSPTRAPRPTPARRWPTPAWPRRRARPSPPRPSTSPSRPACSAATWPRASPSPTWWSRRPTACRWSTRATSSRTRCWREWDTQRAPHHLGEHPGLVQHALRGGRRPRASRRTASRSSRWSAAAASAARSARCASRSPRCWPAPPAGPVRYVMTRREELEAGMPAPAGHHPPQDRRQEGRHPHGARGARRSSSPARSRAPC